MTNTAVVKRPLNAGWCVRAASGPVPEPLRDRLIPATVPGVVHLDLLDAGLIPDPYLDDNESLLSWIGLVDWTYRTVFVVSAEELAGASRHDLVFDGLDTVASISLNDEALGDVANQHRSYRFDVTQRLREGENVLTVAFRSPVRWANEQSLLLGARPRPYPLPYEAIRKSACSFGWDWGPNTATSGIWRGVRLESWGTARLDHVLVRASPEEGGGGGFVDAEVRLDRVGDDDVTVTLEVGGVLGSVDLPAGVREASVRVRLPVVERWWPAGHGEQPLYAVSLRLCVGDDVLDETTRRVGFRTLRWDTHPDAAGTPFQLVVNDRPIFVKGVNWIPDDAFPSRIGRDRYRRRLEQAKTANVNLVRVWGGGIYEADDFFDLCDELGLLTWQDFLFVCAAYPEEEPVRGEVEAEARENVRRLAHHASLAMLCGNNENLWGHEDWGWKQLLDGRSWGSSYYYDVLPGVVADLAAHVPYTPGSPFSPGKEHPNDASHGSMHLWDHWNTLDWSAYREVKPRFVAEFGWQGPPAWSTLTRSLSDSPLTPESPGMIVHQKALEGNAKLTRGLVPHYRVPGEMELWHWAMQLNQANAITCALDWFRSLAPHTSGAVVWQLNDCWPVTSWSAIDGDGHEKPLYFALKGAFAPRVVTIQPKGDVLIAVLSNDSDEPWIGEVVMTRRRFDGLALASVTVPVEVSARDSRAIEVADSVGVSENSADELVVVEAPGTRGLWFFAEPRESALTLPRATVEVTPAGSGWDVRVTADVLLRDVTLLADRLDPRARVDRGLVTLLPGESATFHVTGVPALDAEAVRTPGVLRSGNELVTP